MPKSEAAKFLAKQINISGLQMKEWYWKVYLRSEHWANLRRLAFETHGSVCHCCKADHPLDVHHLRYRSIYDVEVADLQILCRSCHEAEHAGHGKPQRVSKPTKKKEKKRQLNSFWMEEWKRRLGTVKSRDVLAERRCLKRVERKFAHLLSKEEKKAIHLEKIRLTKAHKRALKSQSKPKKPKTKKALLVVNGVRIWAVPKPISPP